MVVDGISNESVSYSVRSSIVYGQKENYNLLIARWRISFGTDATDSRL